MAIINVLVPQLSESVAEATMLTWNKEVGSYVEIDEILIEIETDKIVLEVPSPVSGILVEILKSNGSIVNSQEVIAQIDTNTKISNKTIKASPSASKILSEKGLDITSVTGSGTDGRITKTDVINAIEKNSESNNSNASSVMTENHDRLDQRVPMSRLRSKISERLLQSQKENAILTTFNEVNMQAVINLRNKYKEGFLKEHNVKLGFMSFFVKAAISALKKYPILNASVDGKDIIYHGYFDIGIAVSSSRGLVVPILRNAEKLSISNIERSIIDFGQRASDGKLDIDEMLGGTFSISNGGVFGSMLSTPIINPPQSAILGIHLTKERPVVENGCVVIRPMTYLALSYDHRIIDGREAVLGLVTIKDMLEDPQRFLLDL
ncbi:MAG: 2-oxoglutarate dehydrogenase complex dihydrolipoyllysine-residue succinyltransferase [Bordetella sp.]|nr:MAG: 2-oxoglutarate dehydrogenase complex dihydrolipoyllysine-residue succinyltransferase [Bordetella sp.]